MLWYRWLKLAFKFHNRSWDNRYDTGSYILRVEYGTIYHLTNLGTKYPLTHLSLFELENMINSGMLKEIMGI